jgi:hypothetical protein
MKVLLLSPGDETLENIAEQRRLTPSGRVRKRISLIDLTPGAGRSSHLISDARAMRRR